MAEDPFGETFNLPIGNASVRSLTAELEADHHAMIPTFFTTPPPIAKNTLAHLEARIGLCRNRVILSPMHRTDDLHCFPSDQLIPSQAIASA